MAITIGTDPEAFVVNADGTVGISVGKIGGSKEEPRPVEGGAVQEDNVLAEFNTDPASTAEEFISCIDRVVGQLDNILAPLGLSLLFKSSHEYTAEQLAEGGEQAFVFGCDPDFNCWAMDWNEGPQAEGATLRTAGGHVHIGYDDPTEMNSLKVARACDLLLGVPSVLLDGDVRRRELYGSAGACRFKPYGVEYRVLSNFWLQSDELKRWVFEQATAAVAWASQVDEVVDLVGGADEIQRIINTGDREGAELVVHALNIKLPEVGNHAL